LRARRTLRGLALGLGLGTFAWLASGSPARADTDLGPARVSGEVELGYQAVSGDFGSAKFDQYRDEGPGLLLGGNLLLEEREGDRYLQGFFHNLTRHDQEYETRFGRYGRYELDFGLSQFYQRFSYNARSPYLGSDQLVLPPGWVQTNDPATQLAQLSATTGGRNLGFRQRNWDGGFRMWPRRDWTLSGDYELRERDGTQPYAIPFNFSIMNFPAPVDDHTQNWDGEIAWSSLGRTLSLDYDGSSYDNRDDAINVDNARLGVTIGRITRAPDNRAHRVSLSGSTDLPGELPARLAATVSYGRREQDDSFVAMSINLPNPALPEGDLDGRVDTILANLLLTAQPSPDLALKARYRFYDYDNQTDTIVFPTRVETDEAALTVGPFVATARDFRKQSAALEARYRLTPEVRLTSEGKWENWYREDREVTHQNEWSGLVAIDYRPAPFTNLRGSYEASTRDGNGYDTLFGTTGMRMFDVADRDQQRVTLTATLLPTEASEASLIGSFTDSDYDNDQFGLDEVVSWTAGIDASYALSESATLSGFYTFDRSRFTQDGSSGGGFRSWSTDTSHDVGTVLALSVLPDRLGARFAFRYHRGKGASATNGSGVDFPSLEDILYSLGVTFDYRLRENVRLECGYRYERFDGTDFRFDNLGLIPPPSNGTADVMMTNRVSDYRANIIFTSVIYEF
jgi:MtrB/PioB family decaheme-associated outer membrane protein